MRGNKTQEQSRTPLWVMQSRKTSGETPPLLPCSKTQFSLRLWGRMSRKIVSFRLVMLRDGYFRLLFGFGRMLNSRSKGVIFSSSTLPTLPDKHVDGRALASERHPPRLQMKCDQFLEMWGDNLTILYEKMWGYKTVLMKLIAKVFIFSYWLDSIHFLSALLPLGVRGAAGSHPSCRVGSRRG